MSNSPLIDGTLRSPNHYNGRSHIIDRITPHYMAGYATARQCCEIFLPASRRASSNYCIGYDGEIWLSVDECNAAWTSGNYANDNRAITIECANYMDNRDGHVYGQLPQKTWDSLVLLCADICKRNGIERLNYTGNIAGNLTKHKWYQDTDCPGPWLDQKFGELEKQVNMLLDGERKVKEFGMTFLFRPNNDETQPIYFYDGGMLFKVANPAEERSIREAYKKCNNTDIPIFPLGTKDNKLGFNFMECVERAYR